MDKYGVYAVLTSVEVVNMAKNGTMQEQIAKENVFNDFIAAGEYLQKNGYTSPKYMALSGRSNGILVGATMTMRPDLAKSLPE